MTVSEKSITAVTSDESKAKSLETRRKNKVARDALKQKLVIDKLNKETDGMVAQLKNNIADESVLTNRLSNVEFNTKALEIKYDTTKEQVVLNTNSIKDLNNKLHANHQQPHYPPQHAVDPFIKKDLNEIEDKVKNLAKTTKTNMKTIQVELDRIDETVDLADTNIAHIQMQMRELVNLTQKLNTLFGLVYATTPNKTQFNEYCHLFECPVQPPVITNRSAR
tara:strand:+ start:70 stop:735 length:666 start_codon:yes stop_codon:yes gene_type:complete